MDEIWLPTPNPRTTAYPVRAYNRILVMSGDEPTLPSDIITIDTGAIKSFRVCNISSSWGYFLQHFFQQFFYQFFKTIVYNNSFPTIFFQHFFTTIFHNNYLQQFFFKIFFTEFLHLFTNKFFNNFFTTIFPNNYLQQFY